MKITLLTLRLLMVLISNHVTSPNSSFFKSHRTNRARNAVNAIDLKSESFLKKKNCSFSCEWKRLTFPQKSGSLMTVISSVFHAVPALLKVHISEEKNGTFSSENANEPRQYANWSVSPMNELSCKRSPYLPLYK